jgi:hypothetical protein
MPEPPYRMAGQVREHGGRLAFVREKKVNFEVVLQIKNV